MLTITDLSLRIGGRLLIDHSSVQLPERGHVGLVGRNGTGKSTLLRAILGEMSPESGGIAYRSSARIGTVAQQAPSGATTPLEHVLAADTERERLLREAETATDGSRIAAIHARLEEIDAHSAPARAARILAGLGFDEAAQHRALDTFSGGWKMRVALSAGLFSQPDFLLLDEPTNHLDLEAAMWLEGYLARYPYGMLLVSHDRDLLNRVTDGILHLDGSKLTFYSGNYERFERTRREHLARQKALYDRQQLERKHIQSFVDRFRYKASKARQAQSRLRMLERMEPIAAVAGERTAEFRFPPPEQLAPPILVLEEAAVGYPEAPTILRDLDLRIDMDDRIALLGPNGNGKTTLLRLLAGELQPGAGRIRRTAKLGVGYFAQDQFDLLDPDETPSRHLARLLPDSQESKVRAHLGRFGLEQAKAETRIGNLSGGEKARLVLATITTAAPQLLLLDEPTNHLDIDAREALVQALAGFEGAVVLVSHDPHLVSLVADRLWLVSDGTVESYDGDLDDYRKLVLDAGRSARRDEKRVEKTAESKRDVRRQRAAAREAATDLRKAAQRAEKQMESLSAERERILAKLADPAIYQGPTADFAALAKRKADLDAAVKAAEDTWLKAQEALEEAS